MRKVLFAALLALSSQTLVAQELEPPVAGTYQMDLGHSRLLFSVSHLGFSNYTALFTDMTGTLVFDPEAPETMQVEATIKAASLETHYPDPALDFNAVLTGPDFLDAAKFPEIGFRSTKVQPTGEASAKVTGDLTLHGVTKPVELTVSYNGGWKDMPLDAGARIGFSATGAFNRSDFGIGYGVPAPGTTMGVSDQVKVVIETEFILPRPAN